MSSAERYDYSYEQYVEGYLPSLDLFSDSTVTPMTNASFNGLQEHCPAGLPQGEQFLLSNDTDLPAQSRQSKTILGTAADFDFMAFTTPQPSNSSAFASLDPAATFERAGQLVLGAGDLSSSDRELHTFDYTVDHSPMDEPEAARPSPWSIHDVYSIDRATPNNKASQRPDLDGPQIGPINRDNVNRTLASPPGVIGDMNIAWSGPQKCSWQDCASKATFRSLGSLRTHIQNIHVAPLVCTHPGCSYKKPFGQAYGLNRHMMTLHNTEPGFPCCESECQKIFFRKDKMMEHAKEEHELFACPYNHCSAIVFSAQRESHLHEHHGCYECAIGSCRAGSRSYFTVVNLTRHLRTCHRMTYDPVDRAMAFLTRDAENDIDGAKYVRTPFRAKFRDCTACFIKSPEPTSHEEPEWRLESDCY